MASPGFQAARLHSPAFAKPTARQAVLVLESGGAEEWRGGVHATRRHGRAGAHPYRPGYSFAKSLLLDSSNAVNIGLAPGPAAGCIVHDPSVAKHRSHSPDSDLARWPPT